MEPVQPHRDIRVATLSEIVDHVADSLTETVAISEFGRTIQLLKAAGVLGHRVA